MLPVPLFELLTDRDVRLIDVAADEYPTLACNVLAVAPRNVIMIRGNPITRSRLESAGCRVAEFEGSAICLPGSGGPTCLTRPLWRTD
jgi:N-dimethylarginine dimethylaminohydrolase